MRTRIVADTKHDADLDRVFARIIDSVGAFADVGAYSQQVDGSR